MVRRDWTGMGHISMSSSPRSRVHEILGETSEQYARLAAMLETADAA
jgi:hypothetical protein